MMLWMNDNSLLVWTIVGVLAGCFFGSIGRLAEFSEQTILLISFPGEILMRVLKMFILPLIMSSLIAGKSIDYYSMVTVPIAFLIEWKIF